MHGINKIKNYSVKFLDQCFSVNHETLTLLVVCYSIPLTGRVSVLQTLLVVQLVKTVPTFCTSITQKCFQFFRKSVIFIRVIRKIKMCCIVPSFN
jgi:hypothetical protein